jgi:hypothetical protein
MLGVRQNYCMLISVYAACMVWVWIGVFIQTGLEKVGLFALQFVALSAFAGCVFVASGGVKPLTLRIGGAQSMAVVLAGLSVGFVLFHWLRLGGVPALKALGESNDVKIAMLRQSITAHGALLNYASIFLIRVLFPLLLLRCVIVGKYWAAAAVGLVGAVYGLSLMQKSYPLLIIAPSMIYLSFVRWRAAVFCVAITVLCIVFLVLTSNAGLRPAHFFDVFSAGRWAVVFSALADRVLLLPGHVVSDWLNAFPADFSFEHGCGYRFISTALRCEFVNNSVLMYEHYFPENVSQGLIGTYNAAHFAEDYANFGWVGFVVSSALAAITIFGASWATSSRSTALVLAINFPFIATLSSSALQTTLVSGGWVASIVFSLVLLQPPEKQVLTR